MKAEPIVHPVAETSAVPSPRTPERKRQDKRDPRLSVALLFSEEKARRLWESLPEEHRQDHFDSANMPEDYGRAFTKQTIDREKGWYSQAISFRGLPEPMIWELAWCVHQQVAEGYAITTVRFQELRRGLVLAVEHGGPQARSARSLMALSHEEWAREVQRAVMRTDASRNVRLGTHVLNSVKHLQDRLAHAYHDGEWWRLDVWNPGLDRRIPQREHEPWGRSVANFSQLTTDWFRESAKWWLSVQLSTERYVWSSVKSRLDHLKWFQWYIDQVGCSGPQLVDSLDRLRPWLRGFVDSLNNHTVMSGPNKGGKLSKNSRRSTLVTIEAFYRWMYDNRAEAVSVLGDRRWGALGAHHSVLFRLEDKPRLTNRPPDDMALEDEVVSQIAAGSGALAALKAEGGLDDRQAFHALMLLIRTGRRMNEVLMMDFEPLLPLLTTSKRDEKEPDGFVARLAYQQTKITSGDPPTIPVDQEIVDIIRLQQKWAREFTAAQGAPEGTDPRYLFLQTKNNRLGKRPYASATFHSRLGALTEKLTITDSVGRPVKISKTHTFRHTRATDLINAGVPIHVVMRYLGHVTPAMTMHYAKTLAVTAEREFLRYKKVTADGRTAEVNPSDLYDLLHLDQRADRVLPNGWCMLPPRQVCSKGNACLTCDKFVTDASHRDELQHQLGQTEVLIARRQTQFAARHGEPMGEDNVWLAGRLAETRALNKVLVALDQVSVREDGQLRAVRGAGAADRPESRSTAQRQEPTT
ncbi:tyrosine-type recombinase/integrase [Streptomyces sp. E5N91]|uniref:tyrosine-type recombinase/integrase n=1 Tax=Streptomyces sp. E5N91 TaxID=1851996 RepID=UPI000EF62D47|nr:tyrosine-type recombinase/integrase [Streptomyces sp. E5N91]